METNKLMIYGIIILVIAVGVFFLLTSTLLKPGYSVNVKLTAISASKTLYPYQSSSFIMNVTNTGHNEIKNLLVVLYLNGVTQNTSTLTIPAGQSAIIKKNYTYPGSGIYIFQVKADPANVSDVLDRQQAQSAVEINVTPPELPNVFTSIPNTNITSVQSFTLNGNGELASSAIGQRYTVGDVNRLLGPSENITAKLYPGCVSIHSKCLWRICNIWRQLCCLFSMVTGHTNSSGCRHCGRQLWHKGKPGQHKCGNTFLCKCQQDSKHVLDIQRGMDKDNQLLQ